MKIKHLLISILVTGAFFVACENVNEPDRNDPNDTEQTGPETPSDSTDTPAPENPVDTTDTPDPENPVDTTTPGPDVPVAPEAVRIPVAQFKTLPLTDEGWYEIAGKVSGATEETDFFYVTDFSGEVGAEDVAAAFDSKEGAVSDLGIGRDDYVVVVGQRGEELPNDEGVSTGAPVLINGFYVRHITPIEWTLDKVVGAAADGVWYETTGFVTEIVDAQSGVLVITKGENTITINGLTQGCMLEENDNSFSNIGILVGDELTFVGQKNADGELSNAFYIYHETPPPATTLPEGPTPPEGITAVTIEEFLELPVSSDDWYQLTGRIQLINGGSKGNLYIDNGEDEDVRIWVKELAAREGQEPSVEMFERLGLVVGDIITIRGTRQKYITNDPYVGGPAYFVKKHEMPEDQQ